MKVFIDYRLNNTGKGLFLRRLIPSLQEIGVACRFRPKGCDVALGISKWLTNTNLPKVLRLDGIHLTGSNEKIRKSMKQSNALVYQSRFAKSYIKSHMKVPKRLEFVIYNGADPRDYLSSAARCGYLMAAHWGNRKHKCLRAHIEYAAAHPDDTFYLAGACRVKPTANLHCLGDLAPQAMVDYQRRCKGLVYLADLDWCPNVVVESRVAGMEIVFNQRCSAVAELCGLDVEQLYIDSIAKQYRDVFRCLVG